MNGAEIESAMNSMRILVDTREKKEHSYYDRFRGQEMPF